MNNRPEAMGGVDVEGTGSAGGRMERDFVNRVGASPEHPASEACLKPLLRGDLQSRVPPRTKQGCPQCG
jgi:hypothetical protein